MIIVLSSLIFLILLTVTYHVKDHKKYEIYKEHKGTEPKTVFLFEIDHKIKQKLIELDQKNLA
jgi:hypothetical protein